MGHRLKRRGAASIKHAGEGLGPICNIIADTARRSNRGNYHLFSIDPPFLGLPFLGNPRLQSGRPSVQKFNLAKLLNRILLMRLLYGGVTFTIFRQSLGRIAKAPKTPRCNYFLIFFYSGIRLPISDGYRIQ